MNRHGILNTVRNVLGGKKHCFKLCYSISTVFIRHLNRENGPHEIIYSHKKIYDILKPLNLNIYLKQCKN